MDQQTLTGIRGLRVGHWSHTAGGTGCTVILCPDEGAVASASFLGPAPGTREGILLAPEKKVERLHALVFAGGSAFGLGAAQGVVRYLEERGIGQPTPMANVPIVASAIIYDLIVGDPKARPDEEAGYLAAAAASDGPVAMGRIGAGTGATAGKYLSPVPTGLGSSLVEYEGVRVGALAVVNPVGDVTTPDGSVIAGHGDREAFLKASLGFTNTTLLAVGVEAPLTKNEARMLADTAQSALGRVIRPSHTPWDGDSAFVLSTGYGSAASLPTIAALVQEAVEQAVIRSVRPTETVE